MARTVLDFSRIARVHEQAARRLTRLGDALPPAPPPPELPFADYLSAAQAQAAADPVFKQDLDRALAQYRVVGGA